MIAHSVSEMGNWGYPFPKGPILALAAFFDDSGSRPNSPVFGLGGLLGTDEQWAMFEPLWREILASPVLGKPPLREFHLSACRAGQDQFLDYSLAERDHVTRRFREVILHCGLVTVAAVVNQVAWNEIVADGLKEELGGPEGLCFVKCMDAALGTIRLRRPSGERLTVVFDKALQKELGQWAVHYMSQPRAFPELARFSFERVSDAVGLQGADIIASESYQFGQAWLENRDNPKTNPHFKDFVTRDLSAGLIFDRDQIEEIAQRARSVRFNGLPA